jgi:flagellar hook-basal body protein
LPDGTVQASLNDGSSRAVGQLELARFNNPTGLSSYGSNIWLETEASGEPQLGAPGSPNFGNLKARALEQSNVNLADEMAHMVTLQRAFEMSVRAFQQTDSMISQAIHMRKI